MFNKYKELKEIKQYNHNKNKIIYSPIKISINKKRYSIYIYINLNPNPNPNPNSNKFRVSHRQFLNNYVI